MRERAKNIAFGRTEVLIQIKRHKLATARWVETDGSGSRCE
jgi:hypothetical protein